MGTPNEREKRIEPLTSWNTKATVRIQSSDNQDQDSTLSHQIRNIHRHPGTACFRQLTKLAGTPITWTNHPNRHGAEGINPIYNKAHKITEPTTLLPDPHPAPLLLRIYNAKAKNSAIYVRAASQGKPRIYDPINTNGSVSKVKEEIKLPAPTQTACHFPE